MPKLLVELYEGNSQKSTPALENIPKAHKSTHTCMQTLKQIILKISKHIRKKDQTLSSKDQFVLWRIVSFALIVPGEKY